jgi:hypothetical protein
MTRTEHFNNLGNNCRTQGLSQRDAWQVMENYRGANLPEDSDDFWYGYLYGENAETVAFAALESACPCGAKLKDQDNGICHHCLYEAEAEHGGVL